MNRDAVLATLIGFGVGLSIAGLIFLGPVFFPAITINPPDISFITKYFSQINKPVPTSKPIEYPNKLAVDSPQSETIEAQEELLVSGKAVPNTTILIVGETSETVTEANEKGMFAGKISLTEGKNTIDVTNYAQNNTETKQLIVYYTPESF